MALCCWFSRQGREIGVELGGCSDGCFTPGACFLPVDAVFAGSSQ
jgi:hypothetical protein